MTKEITITNEVLNRGHWLHVHIPYSLNSAAGARLHDAQGTLLKRLPLYEGHNMIDVSEIKESVISLEIETVYETVCKEIKLHLP